jgi:diaminopimelate epimerase
MSPTLKFVKMHGLGNDFVVMDGIKQQVQLSASTIKQWSHRHTGIGFDQFLLIEKSQTADFYCRIFNSDGSEAEQCGNGMRCVARFVIEEQLTNKKSIQIETKSGTILAKAEDFDNIEIDMGIPIFEPKDIPFSVEHYQPLYPIDIAPEDIKQMSVVSMGNPHAILFVDTLTQYPIQAIGSVITKHKLFPRGANVGFVEIIHTNHIRLRTFERGVGETLACGSNACAAVVAGIMNQLLANTVIVELELGQLTIQWSGPNQPVMMTGPASRVFTGII